MNDMHAALAKLIKAINENEPLPIEDELLIEAAVAITLELRSRLPVDAVRQGDLPESLLDAAHGRVAAHAAAVALQTEGQE